MANRNRNATAMAVFTAVSRLTGFARIVVVAAARHPYLSNTYQSANTIPNILFGAFASASFSRC